MKIEELTIRGQSFRDGISHCDVRLADEIGL